MVEPVEILLHVEDPENLGVSLCGLTDTEVLIFDTETVYRHMMRSYRMDCFCEDCRNNTKFVMGALVHALD